jgi:hypothetical protein
MKKCPFCAEEIQDAAIVCKHCGRDLVVTPDQAYLQSQRAVAKELAVRDANRALTTAIVGILIFGLILEPAAIYNARKAKKVLTPVDNGYGKAATAEVIGWIFLLIWVFLCLLQFAALSGN